jgi:DNA-nicking Smr family endonuclease
MAAQKRQKESSKSHPSDPLKSRSLRDQVAQLAPEVVAAAAARTTTAKPPPPRPLKVPGADSLSFKDLAGSGGVRPLPGQARVEHPPAPPPPAAPARPALPKPRLWVERRPDAVRARAEDVTARWLDDLRSGKVPPRRQIDLHRKGAAEARQALDDGVLLARRESVPCLLVVCGRGMHSGLPGPVLPDVVIERLSEELSEHVLAFCTAPRKWGGDGALLVMLRPPAKKE